MKRQNNPKNKNTASRKKIKTVTPSRNRLNWVSILFILILFLLVIFLVVYDEKLLPVPTATSTTNSTVTATRTPIPSTFTPTTTPTATITPTLTPIVMITSTPLPLPTSTFIPPLENPVMGLERIVGQGVIDEFDISPDNETIIIATDLGLWLYDLETFESIQQIEEIQRDVTAVKFSPDGLFIATGYGDGSIRVRDTGTFTQYRLLNGGTRSVESIDWSPDSTQLVSGSADGDIKIWDIVNNQFRTSYSVENWVKAVDWSPDGRYIAAGSLGSRLILLDTRNNYQLYENTSVENGILSLQWSPDSRFLAVGTFHARLQIWNPDNMQSPIADVDAIWRVNGGDTSVTSVDWSDDGRQLLSSTVHNDVLVWDFDSNNSIPLQRIADLTHEEGGQELAMWSERYEQFITAGDEGYLQRWLYPEDIAITIAPDFSAYSVDVEWSEDGTMLAFLSGAGPAYKILQIWDVSQSESQLIQSYAFRYDPDGSAQPQILWAENDNGIWMIARQTIFLDWGGEGRGFSETYDISYPDYNPALLHIAISPHQQVMGMFTQETTKLGLWNDETQDTQLTIENCGPSRLGRIRLSPDVDHIAMTYVDKIIHICSGITGRTEQTLAGHREWIDQMAWAPDSRRLASASVMGELFLWDTETGELLHQLSNNGQWTTEFSWRRDNRILAQATSYQNPSIVQIWDTETGERVESISVPGWGNIKTIDWSMNGLRLAGAGSNGHIVIWAYR